MALRRLEPEWWGERVQRARQRSGLTLREAAAKISELIPTSFKSLNRLEQERDVPAGGSRQMLAYVALLAYGFDPDDFGLADTTAARMIDRERVAELFAAGPVPDREPGLLTWRYWQLGPLTCGFTPGGLSRFGEHPRTAAA